MKLLMWRHGRQCGKPPTADMTLLVCTSVMQVQKSASHYSEAARDEITLLTQIRCGNACMHALLRCCMRERKPERTPCECSPRDGDPGDERHCVRLLDHFEHSGPHGRHVCMVFEVCFLVTAASGHCLHALSQHVCSPCTSATQGTQMSPSLRQGEQAGGSVGKIQHVKAACGSRLGGCGCA